MIDLPQFAPDTSDEIFSGLATSGLVENLFPHSFGYESIKDFIKISSDTINDDIIGSISFVRPNDSNIIFNIIGTRKDIYRVNKLGDKLEIINLSKEGGYDIIDESFWSFAAFGNYVIAVNPNYPVQYLNIDEKNAKFKDLVSAPRAKEVKVWGNYIALIDILDSKDGNRDLIAWSGYNNIEDWRFDSESSDADMQRLYDGGEVLNATSGNDPYIFLREKIYRAHFTPSSNIVFTIRTINFDGGIKIAQSLVEVNDKIFFYSDAGFYCIFPDGSIVNIGKDRVNDYVKNRILTNLNQSLYGYHSRNENRVYWAVKTTYPYNTYDLILVYDYILDRWSTIKKEFKSLINYTSFSYNLDNLNQFGNLDNLGISLDSSAWKDESFVPAIVDEDGHISVMSGKAMPAKIMTSVISNNNNYNFINSFMLHLGHYQKSKDPIYKADVIYSDEAFGNYYEQRDLYPSIYRNEILCSFRARYFKFKFYINPNKSIDRFIINKYQYAGKDAGLM